MTGRPEAPLAERDPLDLPPAAPPTRRPAGLIWACLLASVVIAVAISTAIRSPPSGGPATAGPGPGAAAPISDRVNGLGGGVIGADVIGQPVPNLAWPRFVAPPEDRTTAPPPTAVAPEMIRPADLRGTPVVVNFWASTCAPCLQEMPAFEEVHLELGDRVRFVGVAVSDNDSSAHAMIRKTGVTYDIVTDRSGSSLLAVGSSSLPTTVVIDRNGIVVAAHTRAWSADELRAAVAPTLAVA